MSTFEKDVIEGLTAESKSLKSKYFYNDKGSKIFQEIMEMPEYYPSNCEKEILKTQSSGILENLDFDKPFRVVELGAGDGRKTETMLQQFVAHGAEMTYTPIDISKEAMNILKERLEDSLPALTVEPRVGDYFEILKEWESSEEPKLLLFMGGNIGNYDKEAAKELLSLFHENMNSGDALLIGFDLHKNPNTIRNAYSDAQGITSRFHKNLLTRINEELGANFNLSQFDYYSYYHPVKQEVRSYLVSLCDQQVTFSKTNDSIVFKKNELIRTELAVKYSPQQIENLASDVGFEHVSHFADHQLYFTDSLWKKPK